MCDLSIIIPIHNGHDYLSRNVHRMVELLAEMTTSFEVIIVDDGSRDGSDDIAAELAGQYPQVTAVFHGTSRGQQSAIESGLQRLSGKRSFIQRDEKIDESSLRRFASPVGSRSLIALENQPFVSECMSLESSILKLDQRLAELVNKDLDRKFRRDKAKSLAQMEKDSAGSQFDASTGEDRQTPAEAQKFDQCLLDRLMEWGIALRNYRQQVDGGESLSRSLQHPDEFLDDYESAISHPIEVDHDFSTSSAVIHDNLVSHEDPDSQGELVSHSDVVNDECQSSGNHGIILDREDYWEESKEHQSIWEPDLESIFDTSLIERVSQFGKKTSDDETTSAGSFSTPIQILDDDVRKAFSKSSVGDNELAPAIEETTPATHVPAVDNLNVGNSSEKSAEEMADERAKELFAKTIPSPELPADQVPEYRIDSGNANDEQQALDLAETEQLIEEGLTLELGPEGELQAAGIDWDMLLSDASNIVNKAGGPNQTNESGSTAGIEIEVDSELEHAEWHEIIRKVRDTSSVDESASFSGIEIDVDSELENAEWHEIIRKVHAPKYSSIPEQRLENLSQRDRERVQNPV